MLARMRSVAGAFLLLALALAACSTRAERRPALGEAFIGPLEYDLREALAARSRVVARLRHGERVQIIGRRRRFYQIRTQSGAEGWIDGRLLLSGQDLETLRRLSARAAGAPSQGRASALDALNVHTVPHRLSPSFRRIQPGQHVDVIAYERVERSPYEPAPLVAASSVTARKANGSAASRKKAAKTAGPPLAPVPVPPLPDNWLELSRTAMPEEPSRTTAGPPAAAPPAAPPKSADDWALVRLEDGSAGWVLARMLVMEIPDEVAQYAERARIAAYFRIGSIRTKGGEKPVWLWAAQSQRSAEHGFDSLRIFVWSTRRQRYETAFIERNLRGWLPLELLHSGAEVDGFQAVVEERDGRVVKRTYSVQPNTFRARLIARTPASRPASWLERQPPAPQATADPGVEERSWIMRLRQWAGEWRGKVSR
ncbi:MAG: hypothetical protein KatS3mg004_3153 [Bryobacteraceae bacterium]|nr:MAG: hypothetical protein KatS3mg004_3153 [Bryobacteraceae bacterium]